MAASLQPPRAVTVSLTEETLADLMPAVMAHPDAHRQVGFGVHARLLYWQVVQEESLGRAPYVKWALTNCDGKTNIGLKELALFLREFFAMEDKCLRILLRAMPQKTEPAPEPAQEPATVPPEDSSPRAAQVHEIERAARVLAYSSTEELMAAAAALATLNPPDAQELLNIIGAVNAVKGGSSSEGDAAPTGCQP